MNFVKKLSRWYIKFHMTQTGLYLIYKMCYKVSDSPLQIKRIQLVAYASFDLTNSSGQIHVYKHV